MVYGMVFLFLECGLNRNIVRLLTRFMGCGLREMRPNSVEEMNSLNELDSDQFSGSL